ncbi:LOW QUALITY PROTEIN: amnesiac neuropeptides [Drosophila mauritiana]|uniref:LOW QUALITY PROTEIN: amnesiac neuropeptides n=1 Tax=Drosophila mauritiana TaxID=7226 RepID=A0A6P8KPR6_DROMA|nr:LOW QUALITY PROTEIN: amnesiac neuropeptides [Drosophila mauritiana]
MRSFCCCFYPAAVALHCVLLFFLFFFLLFRASALRRRVVSGSKGSAALALCRQFEQLSASRRERAEECRTTQRRSYRHHYHCSGAQSRSLCAAVLCCKRSYIPRPNFSCFSLVFPVGQRFAAARTRFGPTLVASWPLCNDSETKVLAKWPSCSLIGRWSAPRGHPKFSRENSRSLSPSLLGEMR